MGSLQIDGLANDANTNMNGDVKMEGEQMQMRMDYPPDKNVTDGMHDKAGVDLKDMWAPILECRDK